MKRLKKYLLFYCFSLIAVSGISQNPAHFFIGEDEFANTHIYSLKHHPNGLLYAATSYGLYVYQHGKFSPVPLADKENISSLFSLRLDAKNNLYCITLKGEIFKLINDTLTFYTKIPQNYLNRYGVDFVFDDNDNIILRSRKMLKYKNNKWEEIDLKETTPTVINGYNPKKILFPVGINSKFYKLENQKYTIIQDSKNKKFPHSFHTFPFYYSNQLLGVTVDGFLLNYSKNEQYKIIKEKASIIQTSDGSVWFLSVSHGISQLIDEKSNFSISEKYFKDLFISCITVSKNGTVFLGTFGKGVIVIPNINCFEYKTTLTQISGITAIPTNKLASIKTNIEKNKRLRLILNQKEEESILIGQDKVFYDGGINFNAATFSENLLIQNLKGLDHGGLGSLKAIQRCNDSTTLVATSIGLQKVGAGLKYISWKKKGTSNTWWKYKKKDFRGNSVGYIFNSKEILYTNYGILYKIDKNAKDTTLLFNGEPIKCSDIFSTDSVAICATLKNGILFIKNGEVVNQISKKEGLLDNYVKKVIVHNNKLYIACRATFQVYNLKTSTWEVLGKYQNVIKGAVSNMLIANNKIWLVSGEKVLALPLESSEKKEQFSFSINKIRLGDSIFDLTSSISSSYDKNNFSAQLDFRGLLYEKQVKIEYRLNKSDWNTIPATSTKISFGALEPNRYKLDVRINYNGEFSHQQHIKFTITAPFWQKWWFYVLSALVIIFSISIASFWQIKKLRKKNKELVEKQKLKASLLDSELKTLRSQMNPHFIFNALNSIQDLILKEDTDGSYDYVVLFANLVRSTLNYSNKDFIPIEKEVEFLEVYLKLEKLRFGDEFTYQINYVGTEAIEVPSLIVQPFIENALIHGLLHKDGVKNLVISFELSDQLTCIITDNGVGRKRSSEIQERQGGNHESFALEAIKKRLAILSNKNGDSFGYVVTDLYQDEMPLGTQIEVTIPYRLLY